MSSAPPTSEILISASRLCRRFGRRWAYSRIDLEIRSGERVLIFGPNGSGKTTFVRDCLGVFGQRTNNTYNNTDNTDSNTDNTDNTDSNTEQSPRIMY